jgi:hypothetical protein
LKQYVQDRFCGTLTDPAEHSELNLLALLIVLIRFSGRIEGTPERGVESFMPVSIN